MVDKMNTALLDEFKELLDDNNTTEPDVQRFLELNSVLIPTPIMLNHGLSHNAIITKFKLGNEDITDFVYMTKSTVEWYVVLVELENPHKTIFKVDLTKPEFTAEFNNAVDQVLSWKVYIDENKPQVLKQLEKIRVPLEDNKVVFKYVLVIGRNSQVENFEKRRRMFAEKKNSDDIWLMTYDSIINSNYLRGKEHIILSPKGEQGFLIKYLPTHSEHIETSLFSYVSHDFLSLSQDQIDLLKKDGYEMDEWIAGKLLTTNNRLANIDLLKLRPQS